MAQKRIPIQKAVQRIISLISVSALCLTSIVVLWSLQRIRRQTEEALILQTEQNLLNMAEEKTRQADFELSRYADYLLQTRTYIEDLLSHPEGFLPVESKQQNAADAGTYTMQRALRSGEIDYNSLQEEISLFGNLVHLWEPMIRTDGSTVTSIYAASEDGFMLSYDPNSGNADTADGTELVYDYSQSSWYRNAKESGSIYFTDVYADSFGEGLMITCAAPWFRDGVFAGAVGMDIRVTDLQNAVIDVAVGTDAQGFLVDRTGNVIASPDLTQYGSFKSIQESTHRASDVAPQILEGKSGVIRDDQGDYYAFAPIHSANWILCITIPEQVILAPARAMDRNILQSILLLFVMFLLTNAAVLFLGQRFSENITGPLRKLREDAERISGGDLDHQVRVIQNDEVGDLAQAFNQMTASLKTYIHDLTSVTKEKERISTELNVATHIQTSMLPCIFPPFPDRGEFDIFASMNAAKEVGGDFYDLFMVDDSHLAVVMADVSGKGVPAALFMVIGKTLIKDHTMLGLPLDEVFTLVNHMLCESNSEKMFITAFLGVLDLKSGVFEFVNAGHNPPLVRQADGEFVYLKSRAGFVLAGRDRLKYRKQSFQMAPGDSIFLYTDGVTEAQNIESELFGEDRLKDLLNGALRDASAQEACVQVKAAVDAFQGEAPQFDDITMMMLRYRASYPVYRITVPARLPELRKLTDFSETHLEKAGGSMRTIQQVNVALDEIFANIVNYGYPDGREGSVTVDLSFRTEEAGDGSGSHVSAVYRIADDGIEFDPRGRKDPDITLKAKDRAIGGLGIFMVKKLMDSVDYAYQDGQNILTISKQIV